MSNLYSENILSRIIGHYDAFPGKKIRTELLKLVAGGDDFDSLSNSVKKNLETAANAIEKIHIASLIHDDVMDDSKTRRGIDALHREYDKEKAVAAGDYILSSALEEINSLKNPVALTMTIDAFKNMSRAQLIESFSKNGEKLSIEELIDIARGKTGALFKLSAAFGFLFSQHLNMDCCSENNCEKMQEVANDGEKFGIQFQIIDDICDKDEDIKNGIQTIATNFTTEHAENYFKKMDNPYSKLLNFPKN